MDAAVDELIVLVADPVVLGEASLDEAVIGALAVGMNAGGEVDPALDDGLKRCF